MCSFFVYSIKGSKNCPLTLEKRFYFAGNLSVPYCYTLWKTPFESFWPLLNILHTTCMVNYIMEQVLQMSFLCFLLDYLVWRMHWSWRKSLAYDPFCLFWMRQAIRWSAVHHERRPALLPNLFWLYVCWILWCLWGNYRGWPRSNDPWRPALACHWQLFFLSPLPFEPFRPAFPTPQGPYLLLSGLFQGERRTTKRK